MTTDEAKFYRRLRPQVLNTGAVINRVENALESGWPDTLTRAKLDRHIWVELKIAKGRKAKIRVRPEQINWAEDHAAMGGVVYLMAQNENNPNQAWVIPASGIRHASIHGCLGYPCYHRRQWTALFQTWMGIHADLQSEDPTPPEKRPQLEFTPKRAIVTRAAMSRLRFPGDGYEGGDRGSHHPTSARGDFPSRQSTISMSGMPQRQDWKGETRRTRRSPTRESGGKPFWDGCSLEASPARIVSAKQVPVRETRQCQEVSRLVPRRHARGL